MSTAPRDIVIVGGGLAAAKAAETLRGDGYDGRVSILAEESERPYERPPLSKGVLVHEAAPEEVYVHPADFYAEHGIALRLGDPAVQIDRDAGAVLTRSGQRLHFDRLLIATGAFPRELPLGDENLDGVLTLRTLGDSRRLSARLQAAEHATVVGAGWIGCEVAAAARALGTELTMVDPLDVPLERVLGRRIGQVFADLHTDHGVDLRTGVSVSGAQGNGTVEQITLTDGTTIDTQLVIVGIGVIPRVELAEAAGLTIDDGIVVDATLASTDPRILAAGDVARAQHPSLGRALRVEHWANALHQGKTAGSNLLGANQPYDRLPYFYSDQYDLGMEYTGHAEGWDDIVIRGSLEDRQFIAFWLRQGRILAGMNVNIWDVTDDIDALIRSGRRLQAASLADPDIPLAQVAPTLE